MADVPMKLIINCETGEQTLEPHTEEEIAQMEAEAAEAAIRLAERTAEEAAKAEAKASALAKLQLLGLTEEEAIALIP